jgi:hypothetical protein
MAASGGKDDTLLRASLLRDFSYLNLPEFHAGEAGAANGLSDATVLPIIQPL